MNAKEQAAIEKWNKRNTANIHLANAAFEDILDMEDYSTTFVTRNGVSGTF